jgi:predicted membrane protein
MITNDYFITIDMIKTLSDLECLVLNICLISKNYSEVSKHLGTTVGRTKYLIWAVCAKLDIYPISIRKIKLAWELSVIQNQIRQKFNENSF